MQERRYDLDWLRIIAILLLHLFHCAMPFVAEWDWHLKNKETSNLLLEFNYFLSRWRMPLLFFISGAGTWFVLQHAATGQYIWQRTKRLFIPLIFGMLVVVPPQIFFERIYKGAAYNSILEFYPSIFTTGPYPAGNMSWHHLWFIAYLFLYAIIGIPLFVFLKSGKGKKLTDTVARFCEKFGMLWFAVLLFIASFLYIWFPSETHALVDDWATFTRYFLFFIFGYFIGVHAGFWKTIESNRRRHLAIAFFGFILINYLRWNDKEPEWGFNAGNFMYIGLRIISAWSIILALLGYAKKYLNLNKKILAFTNEGIYPFYILHQTFIVITTFYVIQVEETIISKYLFTTVISFVLSVGFYVFLIRPYRITRFLFGMKQTSTKKHKPLQEPTGKTLFALF